jgi:hypothetical protein
VAAELFHEDGWTVEWLVGQTDVTKPTVTLGNFVNETQKQNPSRDNLKIHNNRRSQHHPHCHNYINT